MLFLCRSFGTRNLYDFVFPVVETTGYKNVTPVGFVQTLIIRAFEVWAHINNIYSGYLRLDVLQRYLCGLYMKIPWWGMVN